MENYSISKTKIQKLLDQYPWLTAEGYGPAEGKDLVSEKAELLNEVEAFNHSIDWLSMQKKTKRFERRATSYYFKHRVERWLKDRGIENNHVPNGAFIAAALYLGFKWRRNENTHNVFLNLKEN